MRQRDSIQRLGCGAASLFVVVAASARAQESSAGAQLSVVEPDSCISESRVRERVQQYRAGAEVASELRVRVERRDGVLGFVVLQSGEAVARRQLTQLSAACDERLDSLALAIAVALTNATTPTNGSVASSSLASPSGIKAATPVQRDSRAPRSKGLQSSRQPNTTVDQASDATGAEPADSHTVRSVATANVPEAEKSEDARHPRSADLQPRAAGLEAREARASTASVVAQAHNARASSLTSPPTAALSSSERASAAPSEAEIRDARYAGGAELQPRAAGPESQARASNATVVAQTRNTPPSSRTSPPIAALGSRERASEAPREAQTRDARYAGGAERQPNAAGLESREARASTASVVAQTGDAHNAGVVPPPTAAARSGERTSFAETRDARHVSGAEVRASVESREMSPWGVPSDGQADGAGRADTADSSAAARAVTAPGDAATRESALAAVRDDGDEDGLHLPRGSPAGDVGVMAGARYGLELLPDPLLLFDVGIEVGLTRLVSLEAGGLVSPVKETAADGGRMRAQVTGGELLLCARPTAANVMLRWCAGIAAASVAVRGEAFFVDRSTRLAWAAGLMRAAVRWPADSPVAAELSLCGHANLMRPRMRVLHSSEPDRVSWVLGGSLGLQLVVSLR